MRYDHPQLAVTKGNMRTTLREHDYRIKQTEEEISNTIKNRLKFRICRMFIRYNSRY